MATQGSFATTDYQGRHLVFSWETVSTDITNNTTTISWSVKGAGSAPSGWYQSGNFTFVIDGEIVYRSTQTVQLYNGTVVASGTKTIAHNDDGNRSFTASVSAGIYNYGSTNATGSGTWSLDRIPRQATLTSAPNFNDEQNPKITYSNPAGDAVDKLIAVISLDKTENDIYREISAKTGTSYTFKLTEAERDILRKATTGSNQRKVYFYIGTVIAGETKWGYIERTFTVVNVTPTISPSVVDTNETTKALTGNDEVFVNGHSNAKIWIGATAKKAGTIVSRQVKNGSVTKSGENITIDAVKSEKFAFTVKDNRGNTANKTVNVVFIDYMTPTCTVSAKSQFVGETNIDVNVTITGKVFRGNFGAADNRFNLFYRYKTEVGEYGQWTNIASIAMFDGNYYTAPINIPDLDYRETYTIQAYVEDSLNRVNSQTVSFKAMPLYYWNSKRFYFTVPVSIEGVELEYPVAQGVSGIWKWRKWNSGFAECWGVQHVDGPLKIDTPYGSMYGCAPEHESQVIALPITFIGGQGDIHEQCTVVADNARSWACKNKLGSHKNSCNGYMTLSPNVYNNCKQINYFYYVTGRWK